MPDEKRAAVLLVDDHALFRESVGRFLEAEANCEVVGSVGSPAEAFAVLAGKKVDLVLLDYDLGDRDGVDFMRELRGTNTENAESKVLLVTAGVEPEKAAELLKMGISGVFLKHNPPEILKQAIHEVLGGNTWFGQEYLQKVILMGARATHSPQARLTERESQVLSFVLDGLSNKEIADRLGVSESAVKSTMQQLFQKTGVRTRSQLVRVALEQHKTFF